MNNPNRAVELEEQDYQFHVEAGLVYAGKNEDGENEWIGDERKWERYEELVNYKDTF